MFVIRSVKQLFAARQAVLLAVLLVAPLRTLAQEPVLVVLEPLQRRLATGTETLRFDVYTTGATVYDLTVTPTELRDPDGKPLGGSFNIVYGARVVGRDGTHVAITPNDPGLFDRLGDYRLALRIEAKTSTDAAGKWLQLLKPATLSRVKPDVTISGLRDQTIRLTRPWPWLAATRNDVALTLHNRTSSKQKVTINADPITTTGDAPEVVKGTIAPLIVTAAAITPGGGAPEVAKKTMGPLTVEAGIGETLLMLRIDVATAETLQSRLHVNIAGQQEIEEIPFKLVVGDAPPAPLIAIFLGVLLAFFINYIANSLKPVQENRFRSLQLQQRLARLRLRTADRRADIDNLVSRLNAIAMSSDAGYSAESRTKLETLGQEIDELEEIIDTDHQAAQKKLREVRASLDVLRGASDQAKVDALDIKLAQVETRVAEHRHADAIADLTTLGAQVAELAASVAEKVRRGRAGEEADALTAAGGAPPAIAINVLTKISGRTAEKEVVFELTAYIPTGAGLHWNFGDGEPAVLSGLRVRHTYLRSGSYDVTVDLPDGTTVAGEIDIEPSDLERGTRDAAKRLVWLDIMLSVIALIVATATGIWVLYAGKNFGSLTHYCEAFLWGFGVDSSVRGFGSVMKKLVSNG